MSGTQPTAAGGRRSWAVAVDRLPWSGLLGYGLLAALAVVTAAAVPGIDARAYFESGIDDPYSGSVLGTRTTTCTPRS